MLPKFEELFDGTLDNWKTDLVDSEFNENVKKICSRIYLVPKVHKNTKKKSVTLGSSKSP